jgi:hypothetical protein
VIPPPPPELEKASYKIEYVSMLAQAQKLVMSQSMQSYLTMNERIAALDPMALYKTDWDEFIGAYGDMLGIQAKLVRDKREVDTARAAQQEADAKARQLAEAEAGTSAMKNLGQTSVEEGTAAGELARAMGAE